MSIEITKQLIHSTNERVMHYFREISEIPRGSGKEQKIADYLVDFAKEKGFTFERSTEAINGKQTHDIIIKKPATKGYEALETVILQSHIDMVCQKTKESSHDFNNDPIKLIEKDGIMTADGTTLGADDGIGVACMLAVLESDTLCHPRIEALFTSDEEDGMTGAMAVTDKLITGKRLINIDTEKEGTLYYGCAGGLDAIFHLPFTHQPIPNGYSLLNIELTGLHGGHSGVEIHNGYANAHKLMARALRAICDVYPALLVSFTGGDKRNVITQEATAQIAVESANVDKIKEVVSQQLAIFKHEYEGIEEKDEKRIQMMVTSIESESRQALSRESFERLLAVILIMPNGVQAMHGKVSGLVETSCNLGIIRQETDHFYICSLIRSFFRTKKLGVLEQMRQLANLTGAAFSCAGDYPDWEPNPDSELIARFKQAYEIAFPGAGEQNLPRVESIHAGLECGYFSERFPDMDMIACGPTITGAHTPKEALDIASTEKVVGLLLHVLNQMDAPPPVHMMDMHTPNGKTHVNEHVCQCIR